MRISVFGLGYVGAVTSACLAKLGHTVIGVDPDQRKLEAIQNGMSPIVEANLTKLLTKVVSDGRLQVTEDFYEAVLNSDVSLICVGTPSQKNGGQRVDFVEKVSRQIGLSIRKKAKYHSVVLRSTVLPGTTEKMVLPILENETRSREGKAFGISMNPEFLREGVSIDDFYNPVYTVIGAFRKEEFDRIRQIYEGLPGTFIHCKLSTAEAVKYGSNIFHALKITFANEMGMLFKQLEVDSVEVLEIICKDTKLNISPKYLRPGFAFGGSCLPKDMRAFLDAGRMTNTQLLMIESILKSNKFQIEQTAERIMSEGRKKIAMMGISFKENTDDLRESPLVSLAEILFGRGFDLRIYDPNVHYASLFGSNKEFIDQELPHLKKILASANDLLEHAEVLVFGHNSPHYRELIPLIKSHHKIFDLVNISELKSCKGEYFGLYW